MNLEIIHSTKLNRDNWDRLVSETTDASLFSHSWFLDGVAENWYALVNDDYTFGVPLPYTVRARQEILYTPIFVSYLDCLGAPLDNYSKAKELIFEKFKIIEIEFNQQLLGKPNDVFVCQQIKSQYLFNSQAKRAIRKAEKSNCKIIESSDFNNVFNLIRKELQDRFVGITASSLINLKSAYSRASERELLKSFEVWSEGEFLGGIICLENPNQILYSKGTVNTKGKRLGAMYFVMSEIIERATKSGKRFDFGGSRIEGVKKFNHNLGGKDIEFYSYRIDSGPGWFRILRKIYFKLSKR